MVRGANAAVDPEEPPMKRIALRAALLLVVGLLAGCGNSDSSGAS